MEVNKEEAQRALKIAQSNVATDPVKALRFAKKAQSLYSTSEAESLIDKLSKGEGSSTTTNATSSSSSTPLQPGLRSRPNTSTPAASEKKREYTSKQMEVVNRVKKCKITEYYEILQLETTCEESNVKSAYRKLALALHPDKNGAPGSDEAFKMVSKAFQVLSDPDKRALFDRYGADPDSRQASMPTYSRNGGGMPQGFRYDDGAIDPEELFRMFFGGGGGGVGMGPGVQFGGSPFGGTRIYTMGGGGGQGRGGGGGGGGGDGRAPSMWLQLLPLIALFAISAMSMLPNLFSLFSTPDPNFSWSKSNLYPVQRTTFGPVGVKYYVNPTQFASHPLYQEYLSLNPSLLNFNSNFETGTKQHLDSMITFLRTTESQLFTTTTSQSVKSQFVIPKSMKHFERNVENSWIRQLQIDCQYGQQVKDQRRRDAMGFLGIGADWQTVRKLDQTIVEACEELSRIGGLNY